MVHNQNPTELGPQKVETGNNQIPSKLSPEGRKKANETTNKNPSIKYSIAKIEETIKNPYSLKEISNSIETKEQQNEKIRNKILLNEYNPNTVKGYKEKIIKKVEENGGNLVNGKDIQKAIVEVNNEIYNKRIEDLDSPLKNEKGEILKDKDGNVIRKTKYEDILEKNPEIVKLNKNNPEFTKELLAVYGEKKLNGYTKILVEKGVKTLEEADKVIKEETKKRLKETSPENEKILELIDKNPEIAERLSNKMAGYEGISNEEARNIEAEPLILKGTARDRSLNLIKHFEGFSPIAYGDFKQASRGYGTKAPKIGARITKPQAQNELEQQVDNKYGAIHVFDKNITDKLGPNQIAALSSYLFNTGENNAKKLKGPLQNYINGGNIEPVLNILSGPITAGGKILKGLVRRRKTEVKLFKEGGKKDQKSNINNNKSA